MPSAAPDHLLRSGLHVSLLGAAWTLAASAAGIWIGIAFGSLALIAFGAVGILDGVGSITLAVHFRLVRRAHGSADRAERVALWIISAGLVAVGIATAVVSVAQLLDHHEPRSSDAGIAIAGASLGVLAVLALGKRWLAVRIPSPALLADSHLSAIGAVLAAITLGGILATSALGWWWADPAAALVVAVVAARLGIEMRGR